MITAKRTPGGRIRLSIPGFSVQVAMKTDAYEVDVSPANAELLLEQIKKALEGHVVRVQFLPTNTRGAYGSTAEYCYRDPSGRVKVGDLVEVPTKFASSNLAKVVGVGRSNYEGVLSDIIATLDRTPLSGPERSPF